MIVTAAIVITKINSLRLILRFFSHKFYLKGGSLSVFTKALRSRICLFVDCSCETRDVFFLKLQFKIIFTQYSFLVL